MLLLSESHKGCTLMPKSHDLAKKIPIEHILQSTRGAAGRQGAASGSNSGAVDLDATAGKGKDACNC